MHEQESLQRIREDIRLMRSKRIRQTIMVLLAAISTLLIVNLFATSSVIFYILLATVIFLSISLVLWHAGHSQTAAILVVVVMFVCIAQAMWEGSGMRSAALLVYPAVMLFAMVLIGKTVFYLTYIAMLIYMAVLIHANVQGWRTGLENMASYRWLLDYSIILGASMLVIRVLASDLLVLLKDLQLDMEKITESKNAAEHLAHHDNLTGLPNRRMAERFFQEMLSTCLQDGNGMGLIFVDVDNFKQVNDAHGHQCGDELLRHIGTSIAAQLRKTDRLARIAGDEFLLLLPHVNNAADIEIILQKINQAVRDPVNIGGEILTPALSMGVALAPKHGSDFRELLQKADIALYKAKAAGRNQYQFFEAAD